MRAVLVYFLSVMFLVGGCSKSNSNPLVVPYDISKVGSVPSVNDEKFIRHLAVSMEEAKKMIEDYEAAIAEVQEHDEYHGVHEVIEEAKKNLLYVWNRMRNGQSPDDPELKRIKAFYEDILERYRLGIHRQLEGVEAGNAGWAKEGYQATEQARLDLSRFSGDMEKLFRQ